MFNFFKRNKYALFFLIFLIVSGYAGYMYYESTVAENHPIKLAQVGKGNLMKTVSATGSLSAVDNVDISSKITGRIVEVNVRENQHVNAGDVLVRLDDTALKATLMEMQAKLDNAETNYRRYSELLAHGAISKYDYDSVYTDYLVAKTNYDKAASDVHDTVITTPIDGYIIGEPTPVGQTISSGISEPQVIMSVATLDNMQIEAKVDESDIGQVMVGQKVEFSVDAYPNEIFKGVVRLISRAAETENNVVYYTVYVNVDDAKGKLLPKMTARTEIIVNKIENTLIIPINCIYVEGQRRYVQVYDEKTKKSREVNVQIKLGNDSEFAVTAPDLQQGDMLVVKKAIATQSGNSGGRMGPPPM